MQVRKAGNAVVVVFQHGQDLVDQLRQLCSQLDNGIYSVVSAIGMLSNAELGVWTGSDYKRKSFSDALEVLSLAGTLNPGDEPFFHIHAVLGEHDLSAVGGHLFNGTVHNTLEMVLVATGVSGARKPTETGLRLLQLD